MRLIMGSLILILSLCSSVQACEVFVNTSRAINITELIGQFRQMANGSKTHVTSAAKIAGFRKSLNKQMSKGGRIKMGIQKVTHMIRPVAKKIKPYLKRVGKLIAYAIPYGHVAVDVAEVGVEYGCEQAKKRKLEKEARCNRVLIPASYISVMELCPNHDVPLTGALFSYAAIRYGSKEWRCEDVAYMIANLIQSMPASGPRTRVRQWCDLVVSGNLPSKLVLEGN